jgi:segregation and condensation protein B
LSLKAKIEAIIYASEEPVTLAQLVGVLGEETQAELDRLDAEKLAQAQLFTPPAEPEIDEDSPDDDLEDEADAESLESGDPDPLNEEVLESDEPTKPRTEEPAAPSEEPSAAPTPEAEPSAIPEPVAPESASEPAAAETTTPEPTPSELEPPVPALTEKQELRRIREHLRALLDQIVADYTSPESDRGLEIREVAGGFRLATKPEYHDAVRGFVKSLKPPLKLTLQALETLAVVAYKQPVTAPEISEIRGVDSGGVLGSLMARKLITTAGRKQVIGRPILYKTTRDFLLKFGLKDVAELPSIEEFEKMASELAEQEDSPMNENETADPETAIGNREAEEARQSDLEDQVLDPIADEIIVDGRLSALPPAYDGAADDPSAEEAAIQQAGEGEPASE